MSDEGPFREEVPTLNPGQFEHVESMGRNLLDALSEENITEVKRDSYVSVDDENRRAAALSVAQSLVAYGAVHDTKSLLQAASYVENYLKTGELPLDYLGDSDGTGQPGAGTLPSSPGASETDETGNPGLSD